MRAVQFLAVICAAAPGFGETPDEILRTFEIHPDFQIELVAVEPVVFDPVDLEFDEEGRAFVIEFPGYPYPEEPGSVVLLGDSDEDGVYDTRTVFAEGFPVADSILPYDGGLLVASPPDLLFIKDTDGDNKADVREVWLTGFAVGNQQHNFNGLTYGIDHWVYGVNGGNGGNVYWPGNREDRTSIRGYDFRVNFRTKTFERIGRSSGGFELAMDDWGRIFETHNLHHVQQIVFPSRYLTGIESVQRSTLTWISDHDENGLSRIFPIGKQEMRVNHPEQAGYFSGACGITYYGGGGFGPGFDGNLFVADVVLNLIHRDVLQPDGAAFVASRARDRVEFLASSDRTFRPVNLTVGPDGALYVVDMHRDVIEHPEWIPDEIEADLDLNAGKEEGRIFRVTPKGGLPRVRPQFDREDVESVVQHLADPNRWWRDTARRLLVEWDEPETANRLRTLLRNAESALGRLNALWTLHALGKLTAEDIKTGTHDGRPGVRENGAQLAELYFAEHPDLIDEVTHLQNDSNARVRMQAALSLGTAADTEDGAVRNALMFIAQKDAGDEWTRLALVSAMQHAPAEMGDALLGKPGFVGRDGGITLLAALAQLSGERLDANEVADWLISVQAHVDALDTKGVAALLNGLADGLERRGELRDRAVVRQAIQPFLEADTAEAVRAVWRLAKVADVDVADAQRARLGVARERVEKRALPADRRVANLELLAFAPFEERVDLLFELLDTNEPQAVQRAAMDQLAEEGSTEVAERLLENWRRLGPAIRDKAGDVLLYRRHNHPLLLDALEHDRLSMGELTLHLERRRVLLRSGNEEIRQRAARLFTDAGIVTRKAAIEKMRPALKMDGDPKEGHAVFLETCAKCHQIGTEGKNVGPNLTDIFRKSGESLLHDILDPNAAVETEYLSYTVMTQDGEIYTGMLVGETEETVMLREAEGIEHTIARDTIDRMYSGGLSVMPEELEEGLTVEQMADLLAFLQQPR